VQKTAKDGKRARKRLILKGRKMPECSRTFESAQVHQRKEVDVRVEFSLARNDLAHQEAGSRKVFPANYQGTVSLHTMGFSLAAHGYLT
jgi:hypothetical protein